MATLYLRAPPGRAFTDEDVERLQATLSEVLPALVFRVARVERDLLIDGDREELRLIGRLLYGE
jgi:hypothetical protein